MYCKVIHSILDIRICRINDVTTLKQDLGLAILRPIEFHGHVIRKLSDWCSAVPDISIDAELPSLEVQLGPGDYNGILSLVNSLGDGQPPTPPSDKGESDGEDREREKEVSEKETLPLEEDAAPTSSSYVKLLTKLKMKEVSKCGK